ncbi:hypothetical protein [Patulibacter minatonensis]|uniref:hypothetical protein n=1 Tax=Patulibacter minatonensis TaxID=298163 RepID=UPI0012FB8072|nr:hypothetical protein [Patulibacter minatonensis]
MSTQKHQSPPLPVGVTLDRGFSLLRTNARSLMVPQLVFGAIGALIIVVLGVITYFALGDIATTIEVDRSSTVFGDSTEGYSTVADFTDGQETTLIVLISLMYLLYALVYTASIVTVVRAADRAIEGQDRLPLKAALGDGLRQTPRIVGLTIVFWLMALVYLIVVVVVVAVFGAIASGLAVIAGLAAFGLTAWLGVRLILWPFIAISEGIGFAAYGRAWRLTAGRFWSLFGVLLLVGIVVTVVATVLFFILALLYSAIASTSDEVGIVALIPYLIGSVLLGVVFTAGYIAPVVTAYRTLAGRDNADLWQAATAMGGGGSAPPADPGVRRWDAAEAPLDEPAPGWAPPSASSWEGPARTGEGTPPASDAPAQDAPPPGSQPLGGLPPSDEPSDAERRWGRRDEPPAS